MNSTGVMRISKSKRGLVIDCEQCGERHECPYFEVLNDSMCVYYCESCGVDRSVKEMTS